MSLVLLCLIAVFWFLIIYHHLVYPTILIHLAKSRPATYDEPTYTSKFKSIAILVPAYNEAAYVADKIRNIASLDYPKDKIKLVIACDGCKDNTAQIARDTAAEWQNAQLNISIIEFKNNHGKVAILNKLIPEMDAEIIALSDASALVSNDALKLANQHFENPQIGVVAATYKIFEPGSEGERAYWNYQIQVKQGEASIGSPIGVHGALYFIRKKLFHPLPSDTINDDFILPMEIVKNGHSAIYDCRLIALEMEVASLNMDQERRVRIAAGNLQQFIRLLKLGSPKLKGTAFSFISGKALRSLMPFIMFAQLVACVYLGLDSTLFLFISISQLSLLLCARLSLLPNFLNHQTKIPKVFQSGFYLINGYWSSSIGTLRYLLKLDKGTWKPVRPSNR